MEYLCNIFVTKMFEVLLIIVTLAQGIIGTPEGVANHQEETA